MNEFSNSTINLSDYRINREGLVVLWPANCPRSIVKYCDKFAMPVARHPKYIWTPEEFYEHYACFCTNMRDRLRDCIYGCTSDYETVSMESFIEHADVLGFIREYSVERGREIIYVNRSGCLPDYNDLECYDK